MWSLHLNLFEQSHCTQWIGGLQPSIQYIFETLLFFMRKYLKRRYNYGESKILAAFSYLSIFFAPFIVPLIVYFVTKDSDVKRHSIRALVSHLIPFVLAFYSLLSLFFYI